MLIFTVSVRGAHRGAIILTKRDMPKNEWTYGALPFARDETHDKVIELIGKAPRGKVLDVPTGTGILSDRPRKIGFEVSCCDINLSFFSVPDLKVEIGDLNQSLPYSDNVFDYLICLEGIEHTENVSDAIREFQRVLKRGGKIFLSTPNFLNIERRPLHGSSESPWISFAEVYYGVAWVSHPPLEEGQGQTQDDLAAAPRLDHSSLWPSRIQDETGTLPVV
jgi:2-polyprenyl-3-methyl-5-hydroxy-6-metoxy-1,4-benzoquinol methylase